MYAACRLFSVQISINQKDNIKIMYGWPKIRNDSGKNTGDMLSMLFDILSYTKLIAHEMNLPLNSIPTQCSGMSGA
jgi:acetyl/propionyl-CoA carboxylase alpha subunit